VHPAPEPDVASVLRHHVRDPTSGFSVGSFGAIAEFHHNAGEARVVDDRSRLTMASDRGALRIDRFDGVVPLTYEGLSGRPGRWQQGVVFCLPEAEAASEARTAITELGADMDAIRDRDRDAILFDMGLGARNIDFCVRTADPALIATLRAHAGRSILDAGNPAMAALLADNPHRVAISAIARAEVYQAIGRERTPEGPHTHVLSELLRSGRTHSANIPVPAGLMPGLSLYPANPRLTGLGEEKLFDIHQHDAFQTLLVAWGAPLYVREKARVEWAVVGGEPLARFVPHDSPLGRTALRVALRQLSFTVPGGEALVAPWLDHFDRSMEGDEFDDDESQLA